MNILKLHELKEMQQNQEYFLLLNVLSESAFQLAHIPGSCNVPLMESAEFLKKVEAITGADNKNRRIITYCGGIHCSASKDAAKLLIADGYQQVAAYEGGMEEWVGADNPTEGGESKPCTEQCDQ